MSPITKILAVLFCFLFLGYKAIAQTKDFTFTGTVIEEKTSQPIPYATVSLLENNNVINGTTTDLDGLFSIQSASADVTFSVSFIGYQSKEINSFTINSGKKISLGTIKLVEDNQSLDEVVVRAEVSKTVFKLDKRVFNVGKDIASTGVSALEVLNNVPSVTVNIEGIVSLRGSSSVEILINGKPSVLADQGSNALGTITADMIESIEVITNPSAKYEASGTSGILNIILKKEDKKGWNGSISANTGTPDNHSIGGSINRRTEKFNLFSQFGVGYRSLPRENESINTNYSTLDKVITKGNEYRNENFYNLTLGTDYHLNKNNVLTLSGNFAYEVESQPSATNFKIINNDIVTSNWLRKEVTSATNPKWQYEFNWKKSFENNKDHTFQVSALGRFFGKDQKSTFSITEIEGTIDQNDQSSNTKFQQADFTYKADYVNPISKEFTLETGAQYVINDVGNDFEIKDLIDGTYITNINQTNNFIYNQKVLGVYGTGAYENDIWGLKAGLRVEQTRLDTELTTTDETNSQKFLNWFPTLHSSYKFGENFSLQAGYSRRIFRPRLWDLNPFFNIRNNFNISSGNPDLQPEFTDSYELTSIYNLKKATFSSSIYHRYTTQMVERVITFIDNVTYTSPSNIGTNSSIGFETNGKYDPAKWLTLTGDFNYNYFDRKGTFEDQVFDFKGNRWTGRIGSKFGLPADIDIELTTSHQSGYKTFQGKQIGFTYLDFGIRKKILKGKIMANLGVRDVFASRIQESYITQDTFETYNFSKRGRFFTFGLSYGFGKGEAMTYSGGRRR